MLNQHFQSELKQAFCGDNAGIDMLNRMQELEIEVEEVRKSCDSKIKELEESHEKEKTQIKDDMAIVLQVCKLYTVCSFIFICLSVSVSVCQCVCMSVCPSVCLPLCVYNIYVDVGSIAEYNVGGIGM